MGVPTQLTAVVAGLAAMGVAHAAKVDVSERQQVAIRFALAAGDQPVECGLATWHALARAQTDRWRSVRA